MSLITKCPACSTMFKVVPDQLRVSDGWVRCGQCTEVFDANLNLQADSDPLASHTVGVVGHQPNALPTEQEPEPEPEPEPARTGEFSSTPESADLPDTVEVPVADSFLVVNPHALHFDPEVHAAQPVEPQLDDFDLEHFSVLPQGSIDASPSAKEPQAIHSFLRTKDDTASGLDRSVRVLLLLVFLALGMLQVMQFAWHERNWIAASAPQTKPLLDTLCGVLGCTVGPLQQIESVVIDSSSFTKVRSDVYRLGFTLKNTAQISVATPALELTLTDMQDQPVIRHVFMGTDFDGKSDVIEAGAELSVTLPIGVRMATGMEKVSGYRLLSFYP